MSLIRIRKLCQLFSIFLIASNFGIYAQFENHLTNRVRVAKANGQTTIHIHHRSNDDGANDTLNYILKLYSVVVATPVDSAVLRDGSTINTWYRFRVLEILSSSSKCSDCSSPISPPNSLLPLAKDDIVVPFFGGTATVDGVRVIMTGDYTVTPIQGQSYLLFIDRYPDGRAFLGGGEAGIYHLKGDLLESIGDRSFGLKTELMKTGSMAELRNHISLVTTVGH